MLHAKVGYLNYNFGLSINVCHKNLLMLDLCGGLLPRELSQKLKLKIPRAIKRNKFLYRSFVQEMPYFNITWTQKCIQ